MVASDPHGAPLAACHTVDMGMLPMYSTAMELFPGCAAACCLPRLSGMQFKHPQQHDLAADAWGGGMQTPYLHFIAHLRRAFPGRPLVLLECRHVSLSLCTRAVTPDVVAQAIVQVLRSHHWPCAAFVGHSYGTFVLSRIAQMHRHLVESMVCTPPAWPGLCVCRCLHACEDYYGSLCWAGASIICSLACCCQGCSSSLPMLQMTSQHSASPEQLYTEP